MHDIHAPENNIDQQLAESDEVLGKECISCRRAFHYSHFRRDHSMKDGRALQCVYCEDSPVLSTAEHTHRLKEMNHNSRAVRSQRWQDQEDYKNDVARVGQPLHHSAFFAKLRTVIPSLYVTQGRIQGNLAVFQTYPCPQERLGGRDHEYLFYAEEGLMPEYSLYEFDTLRDVPVREKMRGWRTLLLRLIVTGRITEAQADKLFGPAVGAGGYIYRRKLHAHRNQQ